MLRPRLPITLLLLLVFAISLAIAASADTSNRVEKRQTSAAPSFRFSVHTHAESALTYSISPGILSALLCGASLVVAGLMI
ncbi:hypothetical protein EDC01DRAFT_787171 [Geopyxis carbonaria]|nr:hypothetical protein EDC01DRAFT_787171 [Geopyxis carbonaria]